MISPSINEPKTPVSGTAIWTTKYHNIPNGEIYIPLCASQLDSLLHSTFPQFRSVVSGVLRGVQQAPDPLLSCYVVQFSTLPECGHWNHLRWFRSRGGALL